MMKPKIVALALICSLASSPFTFAFKNAGAKFADSNLSKSYVTGSSSYSASGAKYDPSSEPPIGSINGVPFRSPKDLVGMRALPNELMPLVLEPNTKIILNSTLKNIIGEEQVFGISLTSFVNPAPAELTATNLNGDLGFTTGVADTDPGIKVIDYEYIWVPRTRDRATYKIFYKVKTDTFDPRTGSLIDEIGKVEFTMTFTDKNGGTYASRQKPARVQKDPVEDYFELFYDSVKFTAWVGGGNFLLALPGEKLRSFANINGLTNRTGKFYSDEFEDRLVPKNTKPRPINSKFFAEEGTGTPFTLTALEQSTGTTTIISSMAQYDAMRKKQIDTWPDILFIGSTHVRFGATNYTVAQLGVSPGSADPEDDINQLNFPVLFPTDESMVAALRAKLDND